MAGKRHHIIPKSLQKGFASRVDGKTVFTWLYGKQKNLPKEISTQDAIVAEHFFGKIGEINADDEITELETNKFSPLLKKLRDEKCNFDESKTEIAELIAHFSIRTKFIRGSFTEISKQMIGGMREILTDENNITKVLLNPPASFIEEILTETNNKELDNAFEIFAQLGFKKDDVPGFAALLLQSYLSQEELKNEIVDIVKEFFSQTFDESNPQYPQSIKEGHNKSLAEKTIPLARVKKYEQFNWNVYNTNSQLILGDEACIFREIGENRFKPACDIEKTAQIYFPISSNQILIGTIDHEEIETNVKILNEAIARCSYEQFISSEKSDEKVNLIEFIGVDSYIASNDEITKELDEIRNNFGRIYED